MNAQRIPADPGARGNVMLTMYQLPLVLFLFFLVFLDTAAGEFHEDVFHVDVLDRAAAGVSRPRGLRVASWVAQAAVALILAQTLFLKYYVWGDFVTSNVGMIVGCALALIVRWIKIYKMNLVNPV